MITMPLAGLAAQTSATLRITMINLRGQAEFRANFIASILLGALWQTSIVVFAAVLLTHFESIGGWSSASVLLLAAMRLTSHAVTTLLSGRINYISRIIQEGRIDTYLVRPTSVYRQIQFYAFGANAFGDLAVALTMLVIAITAFDQPWTFARVVLLVAGIVGGALMETAVMVVLAGWAILRPHAASWAFRFQELLDTVGNYPLTILPRSVQALLTIIPVAFIAYLPAAAITGHAATTGLPDWLVWGSPLAGLLGYGIARTVFQTCITRYQGSND